MSVLAMNIRITFPEIKGTRAPQLVLQRVSEVHIESSWKEMFGKAEIIIPRKATLFDSQKVNELFKIDSPVIIEFGYNGKYHEEFRGYITAVSAGMPVKITCQDEMRKVARIPVNYSASNITLEKLLKDICKGYKVDALDGVQLGGVRFSSTTVGAVLKKLQDDWNIYTYMRGTTVTSGKYYSVETGTKPVDFHLEKNLVSNDMNYKNKEDIVLRIKANSILKNGSKLSVEIGEEGGDNLTLTYYNIELKAELEKKVKIDYEKRKQSGFDGTVTAFGIPRVSIGMKINLKSGLYPDRDGQYYVDGIVKSYVPCKIRQQIKIGDKI